MRIHHAFKIQSKSKQVNQAPRHRAIPGNLSHSGSHVLADASIQIMQGHVVDFRHQCVAGPTPQYLSRHGKKLIGDVATYGNATGGPPPALLSVAFPRPGKVHVVLMAYLTLSWTRGGCLILEELSEIVLICLCLITTKFYLLNQRKLNKKYIYNTRSQSGGAFNHYWS